MRAHAQHGARARPGVRQHSARQPPGSRPTSVVGTLHSLCPTFVPCSLWAALVHWKPPTQRAVQNRGVSAASQAASLKCQRSPLAFCRAMPPNPKRSCACLCMQVSQDSCPVAAGVTSRPRRSACDQGTRVLREQGLEGEAAAAVAQ